VLKLSLPGKVNMCVRCILEAGLTSIKERLTANGSTKFGEIKPRLMLAIAAPPPMDLLLNPPNNIIETASLHCYTGGLSHGISTPVILLFVKP